METSLAQAYLVHVPNITAFQFWGNSFLYGSGLTGAHNFWAE